MGFGDGETRVGNGETVARPLATASDRFDEVKARGVALLRGLGERALQHVAHGRGQVQRPEVNGRRRLADDLHEDGGDVVAHERLLARQAFVEHAAQGEQVGAAVDRCAPRLFGSHVVGGTHDGPGSRDVARGRGLGDPEVHHLHVPRRFDHQVRGLHVAMNDAVRVGEVESGRDLREQAERLFEAEASPFAQQGLQGLASHELHHHEARGALGADVVNGDDAGVAQLGRDLRLLQEALLHLLELGSLGEGVEADPLDRHPAVQQRVSRLVDLAEGPRPQLAHDRVTVAQELGHGLAPGALRSAARGHRSGCVVVLRDHGLSSSRGRPRELDK